MWTPTMIDDRAHVVIYLYGLFIRNVRRANSREKLQYRSLVDETKQSVHDATDQSKCFYYLPVAARCEN